MAKTTAQLADALERMERRLAALESAGGGGRRSPGPAVSAEPFWLLDRLARNTGPGFSRGNVAGSVAYGGRVGAPGVGEIVWQIEHAVPDVVEADLAAAAAVLAALGHPLRLEILRRLLLGARTLGELQEIEGTGTTGQVHHHLRELRAAGLIVSQRRNDYAIATERVVPLLVIVTAALGRSVVGGGTDAAAEP